MLRVTVQSKFSLKDLFYYFQIRIFIVCVIFKMATSLSRFDERLNKFKRSDDSSALSKVVRYIVEAKLNSNNRRSLNADKISKAKKLFNYLKSKSESRPVMRQTSDDHAEITEKELKNTLSQKKSMLHDRPYIEKKGENDFLVLRPAVVDPFVTVVPNHIYYNIEKTCVNWLDDCSMTGLRERLLRGASF